MGRNIDERCKPWPHYNPDCPVNLYFTHENHTLSYVVAMSNSANIYTKYLAKTCRSQILLLSNIEVYVVWLYKIWVFPTSIRCFWKRWHHLCQYWKLFATNGKLGLWSFKQFCSTWSWVSNWWFAWEGLCWARRYLYMLYSCKREQIEQYE